MPSPTPTCSCRWGARFFARRPASASRTSAGLPRGNWQQKIYFLRPRSMHVEPCVATFPRRSDVRVVPGRYGAARKRGCRRRALSPRGLRPHSARLRSGPRWATGRASSAWRWVNRHPGKPFPGSEIATCAFGGQAPARSNSSSSAVASRRPPSQAQQSPSCGLTKIRRRSISSAARRMVGRAP